MSYISLKEPVFSVCDHFTTLLLPRNHLESTFKNAQVMRLKGSLTELSSFLALRSSSGANSARRDENYTLSTRLK